MLQETHSTKKIESKQIAEWGCHIEFRHGISNSKGVAIMFANDYEFQILNVFTDNEGRFIMIEVTINDHPFVLVNIYAPHAG